MNDVRKMIYGTLIGFFAVLGFWFSVIYVSACGLTFTCRQAAPKVDRTPIPTLIPASHSDVSMDVGMAEFNKCQVPVDWLVEAWVSAGYPETEPFTFMAMNGYNCTGTFADDVRPLFVENSLWYPGSIGCVSCHNADLSDRSAGLDLTTVQAMLMGSQRADANAKGTDIFGGGNWQNSILVEMFASGSHGAFAESHPAEFPFGKVGVYAGQLIVNEDGIPPTPVP